MRLPAVILAATALVQPGSATWSIIATDRATGQVGGAGATCRDNYGSSLLSKEDDSHDFGSAAGKGVLVGQDWTKASDVDSAEASMQATAFVQDFNQKPTDFPSLILNGQVCSGGTKTCGGTSDQWAIVDLNGNAGVNPDYSYGDGAWYAQGWDAPDYTYSIQGNRLTSEDLVTNAEEAFLQGGPRLEYRPGKPIDLLGIKIPSPLHLFAFEPFCDDLADRLMRAMEAAVEDGNGDTKCIGNDGYAANTAYLVVKRPTDNDDKYDEDDADFDADSPDLYYRIDVTTDDRDAIKVLRDEYEKWKEEHNITCEERPKGDDRFMPRLLTPEELESIGSQIPDFDSLPPVDVPLGPRGPLGIVGGVVALLGLSGYIMVHRRKRAREAMSEDGYTATDEEGFVSGTPSTELTRPRPVTVMEYYKNREKERQGLV